MDRQARAAGRYALVWAIALGMLFPFMIMLGTALKPPDEVFSLPPRVLPEQWEFGNFEAALSAMPFWRYLGNTLLVSGLCVLGSLISCPLVAYSLAKLHWPGRNLLLALVLGSMMLPPQVTLVPLYLLWNKIGLVGTYFPLIVPSFLGTPFLIFMLRQFLVGIPDALLDAARIDGASELRVYWRIVLPLARPALATVAVFQFVWTWTDFLNPLIYLSDSSQYTLSIGLYAFFSERGVDWGPLMAASVMFTLPALIIFLLGQRYFVEGIATKGLK
ncbi:carbohydrate ABC transporter permease [Solwaraspora sp. WMMD1047]|uniref:carbohydrate ABC transporter permease n=1 Tax=Solwaraspora sp. WMMD1047 TaxID=3016102 RepID=UPI0024176305|nr:carbohydrate ABC transporter permease [Solwaraspora sp. WMMD1047]MDG4833266.1 carbohydrate ABC transporter permease [Solwaraspora sp. WMMD1047]